ncbi:hypothetical protein SteCoe_11042 [Stentor coeruleus]|uniref:phosphoglycerate mutase (2,3-diphosphoglycerate-dependent) n=1 Tax=Stentor coeruleus TaxID=5963 RepID=A0A1R2CE33_9CILI|nr:hypothetical protein SteCoe_11042 [Stentor coeruleus]
MSSSKTATLAIVGAGESIWTEDERTAGWVDLPLSESGLTQAREAAAMLGTKSIRFSAAFTSMMKRGIHTLNIILDELDINWIKYKKHWRLNPQHFGALQKLTKQEIRDKYGKKNYKNYMHSYSIKPPALEENDEGHPSMEVKYTGIPAMALPGCESLEDTEKRLQSYWTDKIAPALLSGKNVLVVSHRNTIRALRKILGDVDETSITSLIIPPGIPRVYEFNDKLQIIDAYYLADDEEVRNRTTRT